MIERERQRIYAERWNRERERERERVEYGRDACNQKQQSCNRLRKRSTAAGPGFPWHCVWVCVLERDAHSNA